MKQHPTHKVERQSGFAEVMSGINDLLRAVENPDAKNGRRVTRYLRGLWNALDSLYAAATIADVARAVDVLAPLVPVAVSASEEASETSDAAYLKDTFGPKPWGGFVRRTHQLRKIESELEKCARLVGKSTQWLAPVYSTQIQDLRGAIKIEARAVALMLATVYLDDLLFCIRNRDARDQKGVHLLKVELF